MQPDIDCLNEDCPVAPLGCRPTYLRSQLPFLFQGIRSLVFEVGDDGPFLRQSDNGDVYDFLNGEGPTYSMP